MTLTSCALPAQSCREGFGYAISLLKFEGKPQALHVSLFGLGTTATLHRAHPIAPGPNTSRR